MVKLLNAPRGRAVTSCEWKPADRKMRNCQLPGSLDNRPAMAGNTSHPVPSKGKLEWSIRSGLRINSLAQLTQGQTPPTTPEHSTEYITDSYPVSIQNSGYHEPRSGSTHPSNTPPSPPLSLEHHHKTPHPSSQPSYMEYTITSSEV